MLPSVKTDAEWDAVVADETVMRPGAEDICARLGFAGAPLTRFADGTQPVYAVGTEHVLKLFPSSAAHDGVVEGRVLSHIQGQLPIPTPRVRDFGPYENGWQYVLMSRLPGENLARAWQRVPREDRERLVTEIGAALAVLHSLDIEPLGDVLGPGDWGAFVDRQTDTATDRQLAHGLSQAWLEQIPAFLASVPLPRSPHRSLLHTEVMRAHLLVDPDGWRLTGLFDFEPAAIGDHAYDFVGVGLFVTGGDPALLTRLTTSYGRDFDPRVLLAYTLLHRYSNLPWYMRELPTPAEGTLDTLAETWFGTK